MVYHLCHAHKQVSQLCVETSDDFAYLFWIYVVLIFYASLLTFRLYWLLRFCSFPSCLIYSLFYCLLVFLCAPVCAGHLELKFAFLFWTFFSSFNLGCILRSEGHLVAGHLFLLAVFSSDNIDHISIAVLEGAFLWGSTLPCDFIGFSVLSAKGARARRLPFFREDFAAVWQLLATFGTCVSFSYLEVCGPI